MQGFRCCHASRVHITSRNVYIRRCRTDRHNGRSDKAILRQRARGSCSLSLVVNRYSSSFSSIFLFFLSLSPSLSSFHLSWSSPLSRLQGSFVCTDLIYCSYVWFDIWLFAIWEILGAKLRKGQLGISFGIFFENISVIGSLVYWWSLFWKNFLTVFVSFNDN